MLNRFNNSQLNPDEGIIKGSVYDDYTKKHVSYGFAAIKEKNLYTLIDTFGNFELMVPSGYYLLNITSVGNKDMSIDQLEVFGGTVTELKVYLGTSMIICR